LLQETSEDFRILLGQNNPRPTGCLLRLPFRELIKQENSLLFKRAEGGTFASVEVNGILYRANADANEVQSGVIKRTAEAHILVARLFCR
jgi:hypothetical protein